MLCVIVCPLIVLRSASNTPSLTLLCLPREKKQTRPMAMLSLAAVWVYSALWAIPPLVGWSRYTLEGFQTTCSYDYLTRDATDKYFLLAVIVGEFFVFLWGSCGCLDWMARWATAGCTLSRPYLGSYCPKLPQAYILMKMFESRGWPLCGHGLLRGSGLLLVREKSGNFETGQGNFKFFEKVGRKSQGILKLQVRAGIFLLRCYDFC